MSKQETTESASTGRRSMREVTAAIVLATDLPMPTSIRFGGSQDDTLFLDFATIDDGVAWCVFLGINAKPYLNRDGNRYLGADTGSWHGWRVVPWARKESGNSELDVHTTAALTAIAEAQS